MIRHREFRGIYDRIQQLNHAIGEVLSYIDSARALDESVLSFAESTKHLRGEFKAMLIALDHARAELIELGLEEGVITLDDILK